MRLGCLDGYILEWLHSVCFIILKAKTIFVDPELAEILVFDDSPILSTTCAPSNSNGCGEHVGGHHRILIGILNVPSASPCLEAGSILSTGIF